MPRRPSASWRTASLADATCPERAALHEWTGPFHRAINDALAGKAPLTDHLASRIGAIDRVLARHPLTETASATRLVGADAFGVDRADDLPQVVGQIFASPGYTAASVSDSPPPMKGRQRVEAHLVVPAGTEAAYIAEVSAKPHQGELLLRRGLLWRLAGAHYDDLRQRWVVDIEIL